MLAQEQVELVERALGVLDELARNLVVSRRMLGQDYRSLALDHGISEGAVRMRLSRALNRMSRAIESG